MEKLNGMHFRLSALFFFCLMAGSPILGQDAFPREEFEARREKLFDKLGDNIGIVWGGFLPDAPVRFRQSPDLYYLCGIEDPEVVLLLDGRVRKSFLFSRKPSEMEEKWEGESIWNHSDLKGRYGIDSLIDMGSIWLALSFRTMLTDTLFVPLTPVDEVHLSRFNRIYFGERNTSHPAWFPPFWVNAANRIKEKLPSVTLQDINPFLDSLRWIKSAYEINQLKVAGRIGAEGVQEAVKATRPGMYEYELEAVASFHFARSGARGRSYAPSVPSGPNLNTLLYFTNDRQMKTGDVVAMSYGCDYRYYASDISRTWPVSGRFSEEYEKMYTCILDVRKTLVDAMKPGMTLDSLQSLTRSIYQKHGYGDRHLTFNDNLGHYVGLSTYDPGPYGPGASLQAGMVLALEPFLDDPERKVILRLGDTVLITEQGAEILTGYAPVELEDLYQLIDQDAPFAGSKGGEKK